MVMGIIMRQLQSTILDYSKLPRPDTSNTIAHVLAIVFGITAGIAVLMVVIGGFRYITAHGDPGATAQARQSIIYAVVGLIITMAAYAIVSFVVRGVA